MRSLTRILPGGGSTPTSASVTQTSGNSSLTSSYPQSRKAPSVNFMMLPLCTSVTLRRPFSMAC